MERIFVKVFFDIDCKWKVYAPSYRVFVNDELFAERTFIWHDAYLTEMLQIEAEPGQYRIRVESIDGGKFRISNHFVGHGPARWIDNETIEIMQDES